MTTTKENNPTSSLPPAASAYGRGHKVFVLITLLVSWILANADRMAMSVAIIPITQEFDLDAKAAGLVLGSFYISYAAMQLAAGWLADRFGSRAVLVFCVGCWSVFTSLTGMAGSLFALIAIRLLFGLGEGGFAPASTVTIAEAFPRAQRARAKSLIIGASFIGSAVGTGAIAALMHAHGWRFAYHVFGGIGVVVALALWFAVKPSAPRKGTDRPRGLFTRLFRHALLRKTTLIFFFSNIVYIGLISWMPTFLMKTRDIDILHVGVASSIPYLVAFAALNGVGWLLDKVGDGRERLFMSLGAATVILFLGLMMFVDSLPWLLTCWTLSLVGYTAIYGTVFAIPLKHLPDDSVGTASGIINFGGQVAAGIGPMVIGGLVSIGQGSFGLAFGFLVLSGACALLTAFFWRAAPAGVH
ncbi:MULTISPECIES: MFS transporter [unclassified Pseudomonas]|uniref:MFS transporter n=1 Tax=unclassified Pseudomonas TaxID=196821 RepID=UPI000BDDC276|nr:MULTISPECIES: MFS transporter [unclassified Pseudomonas]PVZ20564.1 sugar phosphate permease [Pseudomonas sp. URIL14HWK12:I12]PVZ27630.1 sugar phosphate permease [Pseudomonas sp. URIL14HWK12:I10]PVZ38519.1 sugar phosphate permease [Pseudomonas sp. URIL14HWK12:I11]SNZ03036.1 Sugar phosphate permease [Pseudomonas sp. URIL14HWK12:I9]